MTGVSAERLVPPAVGAKLVTVVTYEVRA